MKFLNHSFQTCKHVHNRLNHYREITTQNEHVYAICSRLGVVGDVISGEKVKTIESYAWLNFEVAISSSFRDIKKNHFVTAVDINDSIKRKSFCVSLKHCQKSTLNNTLAGCTVTTSYKLPNQQLKITPNTCAHQAAWSPFFTLQPEMMSPATSDHQKITWMTIERVDFGSRSDRDFLITLHLISKRCDIFCCVSY